MRHNKNNLLLNVLVCGLVLGCGVPVGMAEEDLPTLPAAEQAVNPEQEEPPINFETEGDFFLGYRFLSTDDSLKAAEYLYPHSSLSFGLDLLSCPLPYRYHINSAFISKHDFYSDAGFAYKDLVLFRDILVGVRHNLDHYDYQYPGEPLSLVYTEKNSKDDYYLDFTSNLMSLRLKTNDFPFHTFMNYRYVEQEGTYQQRFLLGYFNELNMVTESRDIEWNSNALKLGANSHFGPVELEYAYDYADFDPGRHHILYDNYPPSNNLSRPEDIYPHNVIPETESSANTIKMHSSYTGGIVAAASLSNLSQKNNYSGTESSTWKGAFDFNWIPDPVVGLFFKYRHRDVDMDTPDEVTLSGKNNTINYTVRDGISYDKDVFTIATRYKPHHILSLFATYEFSHLDRQNIDDWDLLSGHTDIHSLNFTAHARPFDRVKVKAIYEYKNYDQPSYNTTPDSSNKLRLTTNYIPASWLNIYLEYVLYKTERDPLLYLNSDPAVLVETGDRDGRNDQFLASLTTIISPKTSVTFSWFYQRWNVDQDLAYGKRQEDNSGDLPYIDDGVSYTDKANSFSVALHWIPREDITVAADLTYTRTKGTTGYNDVVGNAPYSLSDFSNFKAAETSATLDLTKRLSKDWEIGLRSYLNNYNDKTSGHLDGNVFATTFAVKRYF